MTTIWDERGALDTARALAADGLSAAAIASVLRDKYKLPCTRNAVIGKLSRSGIGLMRGKVPPRAVAPKRKRKPAPPKLVIVKAQPLPAIAEPPPAGDVDTGCRWLHGEPSDRNFCGHARQGLTAWCQHHSERIWEKGTSANTKKREYKKPSMLLISNATLI